LCAVARLALHAKGGAVEAIRISLAGMASVFEAMASTPLITLASVVFAISTLVMLFVLYER
jgi:hypothetical protein